jgi:uncharacterized protein (TIGR02680 family)
MRFKPARAGIINLWDYFDEEFLFADGRLALRGHNGSGKTKALEVLFPFILDGSLDARRLDPFSGDNRTMKSNLLYRGQDAEHGYVWMEFARDGQTVTLIIGLSVHKNMDRPRPSFYVTDKRIGVDFGLLSPDSRPLTARQLIAVLGRDCYFGDRRGAYQEAVDERLFGLGRERYLQLLDLLIALRRPLLAKDLDPAKVSDTLTSGLSPVDEDLIIQAARDFENLAAVQKRHDDLSAADEAVRAFLEHYASYVRAHARHQLDQLESRIAAADEQLTTIRDRTREVALASEQERHWRAAEADASAAIATHTARLAALRDHDAYRDHEKLALRRAQLDKESTDLRAEESRLARARSHADELDGQAREIAVMAEENGHAIARLARELTEAARTSRIELAADEDAARALAAARREDIRVVREQLGLVRDAERDRGAADAAFGTAREKLEAGERSLREAQERLAAERADFAAQLTAWNDRWELDLSGDVSSLAEAFADLTAERGRELAGRRAELRLRDTELAETAARLGDERAAVAAERDDAPPPSSARSSDRSKRRGGPLWCLVDFRPGVDPGTAAAIEGALYGAGLLTAWVHPDPALTAAAVAAVEADGYLVAGPRPDGGTLADFLVPSEQDMVPTAEVVRVLKSIAVSGSPTGDGISTRGQFSLGVLVGACPKQAAEFIGATNRRARRRARLASLDEQLSSVAAERARLADEASLADSALEDLERARHELPKATSVTAAERDADAAAARLSEARGRLDEARIALDAAVAELDARSRRVRRLAAERGLPSGADELGSVEQVVAGFERTAEELLRARALASFLEVDLSGRRGLGERLRAENDEAAAVLAQRRTEFVVADEELRVLEQAGGAEYRRVSEQIAEARGQLEQANGAIKVAAGNAAAAHDTVVAARRDVETGGAALTTAVTELFASAATFGAYCAPDLRPLLDVSESAPWPAQWPSPADFVPDGLVRDALPDGATAVLDAYAAALSGGRSVADGTLRGYTDRVWSAYRDFENALKAGEDGYQANLYGDAPFLVEVETSSGRLSAAAFADSITEDVASQSVLLSEHEQTVLEDSLLTSLAGQIHSRVLAARDLVATMDADTRSKPMSSGMAIGIAWVREDDLSEQQAAVSRLLGTPLDSGGLATLRGRLRSMIHARRAEHPRDTYREVLAAVLDYRSWHRFELRLLSAGSPPARLTRKKHSEMSGGEKSAAIHMPLFAAANALYSSAKPDCPRLVALDEAFAGIDDKFKPELLGLTVKFDLDLFMTGHDLWITYPSVPMIAHYDMHHDKAANAISALLVLWDGAALLDADAGYAGNEELAASLLGFAPSRHAPASVDGVLVAAEG